MCWINCRTRSVLLQGADFGADGDEELPASQAGKKGGKKKKGKEGKGRSVTSASTAHGLEDEENGHPDMDDDGDTQLLTLHDA